MMEQTRNSLRGEETSEKKVSQIMTDDEILKELCAVNGVTFERLSAEGPLMETIDVFFSGFPRFVPLKAHFPNVTCLCIMGQEVTAIEHIGALYKLQELWIAECKVKSIAGIQSLLNLVKLYLYDNRIQKIEGINTLTRLECLWLNSNCIQIIEGIEDLTQLRDLNLAENQIQTIGHSLDTCQLLETLELSGNRFDSFKEVTTLTRLPRLKQLGFNDSKYSSNPLCQLCNYTTQILYHLPGLVKLDGHNVTDKPYKELAETTVLKKKMFYNMKLKVLQRNASRFIKKLTEYKDQCILNGMHERLTLLWELYKQLEFDLQQLHLSDISSPDHQQYIEQHQQKMAALGKRIGDWERKCEEVTSFFEHYKTHSQLTYHSLYGRLLAELQSGGNIRFEAGLPSDPWFASCFDLMLSRFCASDYKDLGITGIKIHRITRVHNRMLRFRFDEKLVQVCPDNSSSEDSAFRSETIRKQTEYLFWVWDPELLGGRNDSLRILEEGFLDAPSCLKLGKHGAVPLANCLSIADRLRMQHAVKNSEVSTTVEPYPYRFGQLVITKAFLGSSEPALDVGRIKQELHARVQSVYKPRKCGPLERSLAPLAVLDIIGSQDISSTKNDTGAKCDCGMKQCEFFVFDHELAVPEYVVEFEYLTTLQMDNPFSQFDHVLFESPAAFTSAPFSSMMTSDDDVINLPPFISSNAPKLNSLAEDKLVSFLNVDRLEHISVLNVHNQGISRLAGIQSLVSLRTLVISFNELSRLDDLSAMRLEDIDASFNKITTLDGMKNMTSLKVFDISWNCMRYIRDEFAIIRKHAPMLEHLHTQHNLWLKPTNFRLRVISRLKTLQSLDGVEISEAEATAALRLAAGSRISQVQLMSSGRTDINKPRYLSLLSTAQYLAVTSRCLPSRVTDQSCNWMTKITSLCLDGQHLSKLSNLEKLTSLKWASFCDNDIVKIEGLDCCLSLEELYLSNNCIYKLEGLTKLTNLRKLSLSENYLVHIDSSQLERLSHLHYLALDHNKISSLNGVQRAKALIELYMAQNRISSARDSFFLKMLASLAILDLSENPLTSTENYRMFMIFHLSTLKALDGSAVDATELTQAREILGGRLTFDFIAEHLGHSNFPEVRELDFPQLSLRSVDFGSGEQFIGLRSVNLEHNNLTSLGGLINLPNLRVLCLNHNRVECISLRMDGKTAEYSSDNVIPILENLEVLHLGYNGIKDLVALQISRLIGLKALFLQGNELQVIAGLEGLHDLRELVLDKNKIKAVSESSFIHQWNMQELHLEENRIRELSNLHHLERLQRLYLGMNRIQDLAELEKLSSLTQLVELSLVSCPVSRRLMHRPLLVYKMPSLAIIDGIPVTEEEQMKASLYFLQQEQQQQQIVIENQQALPGINPILATVKGQVPVKVTNVSLSGFPERTSWSGTVQFDPSIMANAGDARKRPTQGPSSTVRVGNQSFNIQSSYANQQQPPVSKAPFYADYNSNPFGKSAKK